MYSVIIVDDEYYFRQSLKIMLPWAELGCEIQGEAKNGREGLDLVEALDPDIALVDINMPVMDGLEFVQTLRGKGKNTKVIILTGHSEFNYARQAVEMGVQKYILKPVDEDELKEAILSIQDLIDRESRIQFEMEALKRQVKENIPILKDRFLNGIVHGNVIMEVERIRADSDYLGLDLIAEAYQIVLLEIDDVETRGWSQIDLHLWSFAVSNVAGEILSGSYLCHALSDGADRTCLILGHRNGRRGGCISDVADICESVKDVLERNLGFTVTIGVGNPHDDIRDLPISYREAVFALKNRLILGKNRVITQYAVSETTMKGNFLPTETRSELLIDMRLNDEDALHRNILLIYENIRNRNASPETLMVTSIELTSTCLEFLAESGLGFMDIFDAPVDLLGEIQSKKSIADLQKWSIDLFDRAIRSVAGLRGTRSSRIAEDIKRYIQKNYQNDEFRIDDLVRTVFVNYSHLCYVFKRETGMTINDYLTEVRTNEARRLFDGGNTFIKDVAERVGYVDANYFAKCFKKRFGLTPSLYLENLMKRPAGG